MSNKFRSTLIENHIPSFIKTEYPNFVEFIKLYYNQQDEQGEAYEFIANILEYADVDKTSLDYLENFTSTYLSSISGSMNQDIDKRTLIKNIKQFYESAGSEKSFQFIFRVLFGEEVDIVYPRDDILRVSDGKWQKDYVIKISNNRNNDTIKGLEGTIITGSTSGAKGLVETVNTYVATNGFYVAECSLSRVSPINDIFEFLTGEEVTGTTLDGLYEISESVYSIITDVVIHSSGLYNYKGDIVEISSDLGVDGFVTINDVYSGSIQSLEIIDGGSGYAVNDLILFNSTSGRGAKGIVLSVDGFGSITSTKIIAQGYDYEEMPSYNIRSAIGTGAILYIVSDTIGKIKSFNVVNAGVNYLGSEQPGFPYQFPIKFTFIETKTTFYKNAFVYNTAWNNINYKINETIRGETSGAEGILKRFDNNTGMISYFLISEATFIEGETLTGISTGATGFVLHKKHETIGDIVPGSILEDKGRYKNTDGWVSGNRYIQDSYYYQDFSYAITTLQDEEKWLGIINEYTHPSGTIAFGFGLREDDVSGYSYGGELSGHLLNDADFYKHNWGPHLQDTNTWSSFSNTQISSYKDFKIYEVSHIDVDLYLDEYPNNTLEDGYVLNTVRRTKKAFGSNIRYEYADIGQSMLIDEINNLLIDTTNNLKL